jgi:hypothetical protein
MYEKLSLTYPLKIEHDGKKNRFTLISSNNIEDQPKKYWKCNYNSITKIPWALYNITKIPWALYSITKIPWALYTYDANCLSTWAQNLTV